MISRTTVTRETARLVMRQRMRLAEDVRVLRLDAGVSLRELSAVTGVHPSHIARIETAKKTASIETLTAIGVALGAELSLKYFAGSGPRLVDRFQVVMVERSCGVWMLAGPFAWRFRSPHQLAAS